MGLSQDVALVSVSQPPRDTSKGHKCCLPMDVHEPSEVGDHK